MKTCVIQILALTIFGCLFLYGCTISMQNISSVGKASDMVDTEQEASPDVKADVSLPIKAI